MMLPRVYEAISAVSAELAEVGIPKAHLNVRDQYQYRSIDDVLNRLAPVLPKHRLCVLPRVLERITCDRVGLGDAVLVSVCLRVAFDIVSAIDASVHTVEVFGEALDEGDKGTAKAMSSAYKAAMLQTFCIPVAENEDADARSPKLKRGHQAEPVTGWAQWVSELLGTIGICEAPEALSRLQKSQRGLLLALSREQPELYVQVGAAFAERIAQLGKSTSARSAPLEAVARTATSEDGARGDLGPVAASASPATLPVSAATATTSTKPPKQSSPVKRAHVKRRRAGPEIASPRVDDSAGEKLCDLNEGSHA